MRFVFPGRRESRYFLRRVRLSQYDIDVRRGPQWWRNLLIAILPKLLTWLRAWPTALAPENKTQYVNIEEESFVRGLLKSRQTLDRVWEGGYRVYAGPDVFPKIEQELMEKASVFSFNAPAEMGRDGSFRVVGIPVTFVPWLKGHVLVPEPNEPQRRFA